MDPLRKNVGFAAAHIMLVLMALVMSRTQESNHQPPALPLRHTAASIILYIFSFCSSTLTKPEGGNI